MENIKLAFIFVFTGAMLAVALLGSVFGVLWVGRYLVLHGLNKGLTVAIVIILALCVVALFAALLGDPGSES